MSTLNTTSATNFMVEIPDYSLTRTVQMQVQIYNPPVIEIPMVKVPSSAFGKSQAMLAGTSFLYKPMKLSILVDRDFVAWTEVYKWALGIENYRRFKNDSFENITPHSMYVHILDNHRNDTVLIHEFKDPFPHLIYPPTFNHSAGTDYPMIMTIEVGYSVFNVLDKDGNEVLPRQKLEDAMNVEYKERRDDYIKP